ncbi:cytochrome c oxidase subunit IVB [Bacillus tequilensis]|uniref:Cytochrome c oxidase subunit IVB n=1 Tax=Bacillus tequilensis TaxID=227866 RepID=A0A6H0WHP2_9BACI|nr:cytochrome c oxidase subunit IVB [Bacillus tequilensis]MDR4434189.1 cytochrome c oxidase subunit IVB [Bacillus tequilensis]QIW79708.1 cytochrome c oxidase subunit IVB [Bacillus tequilensis]SPU05307.1 cytochrome caa3 oxidase subunit IV [Bacillus tequilensis]
MVDKKSREHVNSGLEFKKKKHAQEMKYQVLSFGLMIGLTIVAFLTVATDGVGSWFTIPFIILLAAIQVIFQLYYFMHMNQKGHEVPALFLYSGMFVAFITVLAFVTIIWW